MKLIVRQQMFIENITNPNILFFSVKYLNIYIYEVKFYKIYRLTFKKNLHSFILNRIVHINFY